MRTIITAALTTAALALPASASAATIRCAPPAGVHALRATATNCTAARFVARTTVREGYVYTAPRSFAVTLANGVMRCHARTVRASSGPYFSVVCTGRRTTGRHLLARVTFHVEP